MPDRINLSRRVPESSRCGYSRFIIGIIVLLAVDIIWVVSAEISEFIFHGGHFDKPYFTTYFKTGLFMVFLFGFTVVKRWQVQCVILKQKEEDWAQHKFLRELARARSEQAPPSALPHSSSLGSTGTSCSSSPPPPEECFAGSTYETMTDDDNSVLNAEEEGQGQKRKVSFNRVREVRQLARENAEAQLLARMSQPSVERLWNILMEARNRVSLKSTVNLALFFSFLWFFATFCYQEALSKTSAAVTNILSSSSGIFTLLLGALFPSSVRDKFSVSKLIAVLISLAGVILISWEDPSRKEARVNVGSVYAILGAILYACYLTLIRKKVGEDEQLDIPLFFGFVGLFGAVLFWPGFFIVHYTNQEIFEMPSRTVWGYLVLNGLVGTVLSELLWLWGCFLTSSLMATLSLSLVIPLTLAWDMLLMRVKFSWLFLVGTVPVFLSFIAVSILSHYGDWDPVLDGLKRTCLLFSGRPHRRYTGDLNGDERESLISPLETDSINVESMDSGALRRSGHETSPVSELPDNPESNLPNRIQASSVCI